MYAPQYYDYTTRMQRLNEISTINANGRYFQKLDMISVLTINSSYTVNVYRRYNSEYNVVIEDCYGNLSFHQDESLYITLKNRYNLSDAELSSMYVSYFYSFKHNSVLNYIPCSIFTMKWSDIQDKYSAVDMALNYELNPVSEPDVKSEDVTNEDENSDDDSTIQSEESSDVSSSDSSSAVNEEKTYEPVMYLASLFSCPSCPPFTNVIVNVQPVKVCNDEDGCCIRICKKRSFCNMNEDSDDETSSVKSESSEEEEDEYEEQEETDNELQYTVLRNGTKFRKKN